MAVTEEQFWTAMKPVFDLLGTDPTRLVCDPPFSVTTDRIGRTHVCYREVVVPGEVGKDWPVVDFDGMAVYNVDRTFDVTDFQIPDLWPYTPSLVLSGGDK